MKAWWRSRTLREQRLLLAMAGLAALVLAWVSVLRPLSDALSAARERYGAAVIAQAEASSQAAALQAAQTGRPAVLMTGSLDIMLNQSATEAGIPVQRVEPEGPNRSTVVIGAVRPQALFGWVRQMEGRGLVVERMNATANSDQTIAVQATFRAGGAS